MKKILFITVVCFWGCFITKAQKKSDLTAQPQVVLLNYHILQGGKKIGWMKVNKKQNGALKTIDMVSEIRTRKILMINVSTKDSCSFDNSTMLFASQFRTLNGNISLDKQTNRMGTHYEVLQGGRKKQLQSGTITHNLLSLYAQEPINVKQVYCESDERFANITRTKEGGYKVYFKNGDSNCYFYEGGVCSRVVVKHSFYAAEIVLLK